MPEIYELVVQTTYKTQKCINKWNYTISTAPTVVSGSYGLLQALGAIWDDTAEAYPTGTMLESIRLCMIDEVRFDFASVRNIYSVTDFLEVPFTHSLLGALSGVGLPPFNALGFRTNRTVSNIRRGTKRFVGLTAAALVDGGELSGAMEALADTVALYMSNPLAADVSGSTFTYVPCVVSQQKYAVPDTDPVRYARHYYADKDDQLSHIASGITWSPYLQARTQTSRQYGRGQ